jgi:hypothetical protein
LSKIPNVTFNVRKLELMYFNFVHHHCRIFFLALQLWFKIFNNINNWTSFQLLSPKIGIIKLIGIFKIYKNSKFLKLFTDLDKGDPIEICGPYLQNIENHEYLPWGP